MVGFAFTSWALLLVTTHGTLHTGCLGQETAPVPHDVDDLGSPKAENPLGNARLTRLPTASVTAGYLPGIAPPVPVAVPTPAPAGFVGRHGAQIAARRPAE